MSWTFQAELWRYHGDGAWHFVTLPCAVADAVEARVAGTTRGFGSVRVRVTVGASVWDTWLFPDANARSHLLPIKKAVRVAEGIEDGDVVEVTIELPAPTGAA